MGWVFGQRIKHFFPFRVVLAQVVIHKRRMHPGQGIPGCSGYCFPGSLWLPTKSGIHGALAHGIGKNAPIVRGVQPPSIHWMITRFTPSSAGIAACRQL